jgi:hypothetical protein
MNPHPQNGSGINEIQELAPLPLKNRQGSSKENPDFLELENWGYLNENFFIVSFWNF